MAPKLVVSAIIAVCFASSANAQVTIDASKVTCEQFVFSKVAPVRSIALWLSGYHSGKRNNSVVDLQAFEENATKVESYCKQQKNLNCRSCKLLSKYWATSSDVAGGTASIPAG